MTTTVSPATFRYVHFDADQITAVADRPARCARMTDRDVAIVVDETDAARPHRRAHRR
jgi:hypothetical protein